MTEYSQKQYQHHVPRFYLRGWSSPVPALYKKLWVYEQGRIPRPRSVKKTGGRNNMYSVINSDGTLDIEKVEKFLQVIESEAGKVFTKIVAHQPLTHKEKRAIAHLISVLFRRDPYTFDKFVPEQAISLIPELRAEFHAQLNAMNVEETAKAKLRTDIDRVVRLAGENLGSVASEAILHSKPFAERLLSEFNWCFAYTIDETFVTSDCPVIYDRVNGIEPFPTGNLLFPISSNIMLWLSKWPIVPDCYFPIPKNLVKSLNVRTIAHSYQHVYAQNNDPTIKSLVDSHVSAALPRGNS